MGQGGGNLSLLPQPLLLSPAEPSSSHSPAEAWEEQVWSSLSLGSDGITAGASRREEEWQQTRHTTEHGKEGRKGDSYLLQGLIKCPWLLLLWSGLKEDSNCTTASKILRSKLSGSAFECMGYPTLKGQVLYTF